ncbi:MAG: helix-turn-helix transcriptional regulator [Sandaracinaceae bacterium]
MQEEPLTKTSDPDMAQRSRCVHRLSVAGQTIGERIREAREAAEVKQVDLAEVAGVRPHTLWRYEAGKIQNPKPEILERISAHLGVDLQWLLTGRVSGDSSVEEDRVDTAAWLELQRSGRLAYYRERGLVERQIQQVRRTFWRGPPTPRDYERLLDGLLLGPAPSSEPAPFAEEQTEADPELARDLLPADEES